MNSSNKLVRALGCLVVALPALATQAATIDGLEWRQLTETVNVSYDQLESIFVTTTGVLDPHASSTVINGVDFAGWTWASLAEVGAMLQATGVPLTTYPGYLSELNSSWAPVLVDADGAGNTDTGHFSATQAGASSATIRGLTRTAPSSSFAYAPYVVDWFATNGYDTVDANSMASQSFLHATLGVWLYRDAGGTESAVPAPPGLGLLALGLIALRLRCRH